MTNIVTFQSIKKDSESYRNALERYAKLLSQQFPLELAEESKSQRILEARWVAYQSRGVSLEALDLLLLSTGHFSFTVKQNNVSYTTYHALEIRDDISTTSRKLAGIIFEGFSALLGLCALLALVIGIVCLIFDAFNFTISMMMPVTLWSIIGILASRFLIRFSKKIRIPSVIQVDGTSPFYLLYSKIHHMGGRKGASNDSYGFGKIIP